MKKKFATVVASLILFILPAHALELQKGPTLVEATPTTLKIEWEKADKALGYYLYYGTISWVGIWYQKQYSEFLESTGVTLPDLEPGKDYYVALTVVNDQGEEGKYSPETVMKTIAGNGVSSKASNGRLALQTVKVASASSLELTFSNALDSKSTAQREFKLIKSDTKNEVQVQGSQVSWNKVTINLSSDLLVNQKYDLTVVNIQDINGKSIESWVDGISTFVTPASFDTLLNSGGPVDVNTNNSVNSGSTLTDVNSNNQNQATVKDFSGNMGQNISAEEIQKNTEVAAQQADGKLPKTGPETIIILMISLLAGLGFFYYKRKAV